MGRPCTVCQHPERAAIEADAASSTTRGAAARWDIPETNLRRHLTNHLVATSERTVDGVMTRVLQGLERLEALEARLAQMLTDAQASGDVRIALQVVNGFARVRGELRANLVLLNRLSEDADHTGLTDLLVSKGWAIVKAAIEEALAPYPDASAAVAARLEDLSHAS